MEFGYLFVKLFGEDVNFTVLVFVGGFVLPELNLGKNLVGEGA